MCLAVRQSLRNLFEKYCELKMEEETAKRKAVNDSPFILPGYMEINPRDSAIQMHGTPLIPYRKPVTSLVTKMKYEDISNMTMVVLWMTYTKYFLKWLSNWVSGMLGNSLRK